MFYVLLLIIAMNLIGFWIWFGLKRDTLCRQRLVDIMSLRQRKPYSVKFFYKPDDLYNGKFDHLYASVANLGIQLSPWGNALAVRRLDGQIETCRVNVFCHRLSKIDETFDPASTKWRRYVYKGDSKLNPILEMLGQRLPL